MRLLDLFSGIGGFSLAASWAGITPIQFVEYDQYCQKVLDKNFKGVPIHGDIKTYHGQPGSADIISGGFPCQPFSIAGKRKGKEDDRYLWPEMLRIIKEVRPAWVLGENVTGIVNMELDKVLSDLESEGYETQAFIIPACSVDAPHRRDRIWIVANSARTLSHRERKTWAGRRQFTNRSKWPVEPRVGGIVDGFPSWLYRHCGKGMSYAESYRAVEKMRKLWNRNAAETIQRCIGGFGRMETAEILFAFVREYSENGRLSRELMESKKKLDEAMRKVWINLYAGGTSQGQKQGKQQPREHTNAMCSMSFYNSSWEEGINRTATGIKNRVARLKGLGNAIVPQVAYVFFKNIMEIERKNL